MDLIVCTGEPENLVNVRSWLDTAEDDHGSVRIVADGLSPQQISDAKPQFNYVADHVDKGGPVASLQHGYERTRGPILAYIHDNVIIHEKGWDRRVMREFADPAVGVVGFGGATGLGAVDIYHTPYRIHQLARFGYASNVPDWQTHGLRFAGERDVAVLDGFSIIVRRELLDKAGGWPIKKLVFHNYDFWLCCMARRLGYRVRQVGVACHHLGGRNSTRPTYNGWLSRKLGKTDSDVHREAHEYVYEEFRDVLPIRV